MKIQILGSGCAKCKLLEEHARQAVTELDSDAEVEKVTDMEAIVGMGVMMTPALVLDGTVKSVGRVLSKDQIVALLTGGKV
jgi:small redox-active disulfide protein 2